MGFLKSKPLKIIGIIFATLFVEAYILVSLPNTSKASTNPPNSGGCGNIVSVSTTEFGTCGTSSYGATYHIANVSGHAIQIHYNTESWYCQNPFPHMDSRDSTRLSCRETVRTNASSTDIGTGQSGQITIGGFTNQSKTCGAQQTDFSFDVYQNGSKICSYGSPDFTYGWSFCSTGTSCTVQPSPTTQPTSMPTATPTPVVVYVTPTPTSVIEYITPTTQPTEIPTATPTEIPTEMPTATPTPTSAPIIENTTTNQCGISQDGVTNNANCQNQSQQQNQYNNQNVNVTVASPAQPTSTPEEQVLAVATVAPPPTASELPSTGGGADVLVLLGTLIPAGIKLRKLS